MSAAAPFVWSLWAVTALLPGPDRAPNAAKLPIQVEWRHAPPLRVGPVVDLTLRIRRHAAGFAPLSVAVDLPPGVDRLAGPRQQTLHSSAAGDVTLHWRVRVRQWHGKPVVATVDWRKRGAGFHAEAPWPVPDRTLLPARRPDAGVVDPRVPVGRGLPLVTPAGRRR